jgi:hypothetical protein
MGPTPFFPPRGLARGCFLIAALDSVAAGRWALARPAALFDVLGLAAPADAFLWRVLGGFSLLQAGFLAFAARRRADAGYAWVAVAGRTVQCGLWMWLAGSDRVHAAPVPLALLAGHDAVILVTVVVGLVSARRSP